MNLERVNAKCRGPAVQIAGKRATFDATRKCYQHDHMELSADGSGLIRSDLDAERELVRCLIVDPHCSDRTSRRPQTRFPLLRLRDLLGLRARPRKVERSRGENLREKSGFRRDKEVRPALAAAV